MALDFSKTTLNNDLLTIQTDDGIICIPKEGANAEELAMFDEYLAEYPDGKPVVIDIQALIVAKIQELSIACNNTITRELQSDVDGTMRTYDYELENQVNLDAMVRELKDAKRDGADLTNMHVSYYAKGEPCHDYTAEQLIQLDAQGKAFKLANIQQYKDNLKLKAEACTTQEEINDIKWEAIPSMTFIDAYKATLFTSTTSDTTTS